MSQPFNCNTQVPSLREVDEGRGEFWVPSPWMFSQVEQNLSAYERNGCFLNTADGGFLDISYLSGTDNPGDARTVIGADVTGDGMPELFVRQAGGGPLVIYRNDFPQQSWLVVSLAGSKSNSAGIGSRIECRAGDLTVRRELYPVVNFLAQQPARSHLGLGDAERVDELTIRWPSGHESHLTDIPINRHIRIHEEGDRIEVLGPGPAESTD